MKRTFQSIFAAAIALMMFVVLPSCEKNDTENQAASDVRLKGIWKIVGFRMNGSNLNDYNPLSHIVIDPESNDFAMVLKDPDEARRIDGIQAMKMIGSEGTISIFRPEKYDSYLQKRDDNLKTAEFAYSMLEDDTILSLEIPASVFLTEEMIENPADNPKIYIQLHHDAELEGKVGETDEIRGFWDISSWVLSATVAIIRLFSGDDDTQPDVNVHYDRWPNTGGWLASSWMSNLPLDTPVCKVNIPGSHDSATKTEAMSLIATKMNANCQSLSIHDQFVNGARYFDFRVGTDFVWHVFPLLKRIPNAEDRAKISDLEIFHGNFSTDVYYKKALKEIAELIKDGGDTEFVFINTQWENMSYGLIDFANLWLDGKLLGDEYESDIKKAMSASTMEVADRLQRELNAEYNGNLFITYRPDLTVREARGHIILLEEPHGESSAYANPQCTYVFSWPDNSMGYAHACPYDERSAEYRKTVSTNILRNNSGFNMRVQSYYQMKLDETDNIDTKTTWMKTLATQVTEYNTVEEKRVLGFNAMNVNSASADLNVDDFAHKFNGKAFDMFVENMKNDPVDKRFCSGIVTMDYFGSKRNSHAELSLGEVYGDLLSWAVIESNFYKKQQ